MSYPKKLLSQNETVALDVRPHWWYFGHQIFTGLPLLLVIILSLTLDEGFFRSLLGWAIPVASIVWLTWITFRYFSWTRTYFVITNKRVIFRTGIIARKGVEIPLDRIMNINFEQRIFERIIGVGNLEVQSAGEQGTSTFNFVSHPDEVQGIIYQKMEEREQHQADIRATSLQKALEENPKENKKDSVLDTLDRLADLKEKGHLTDEEFQSKKKDLLSEL